MRAVYSLVVGGVLRLSLILLAAIGVGQFACGQTFVGDAVPASNYRVAYSAEFIPGQGSARVTIDVDQAGGQLLELDFNAPQVRYSDFMGDGDIRQKGQRVVWALPAEGGRIVYQVRINEIRGTSYDALITDDWAVLRLDDLFPPAKVRSLAGAKSLATLMLSGPEEWSFETGYGRVEAPVAVTNPDRRFVRPVGWLAAGDLGVRRDQIGQRMIAVAAPRGESFRRLDILTFLNWTLPGLVDVFPSLPDYLLVVGGSREMWRGALSGPASLYMHPDRPLVSGNATSTLLHELVHVAMPVPPSPGADWIVEGLAEYYSLTVLLRSGGISRQRYEMTLQSLEQWAERDQGRLADPSKGADTAFAVGVLARLDLELKQGDSSLDSVVEQLWNGRVIDQGTFIRLVESELGGASAVLTQELAGKQSP